MGASSLHNYKMNLLKTIVDGAARGIGKINMADGDLHSRWQDILLAENFSDLLEVPPLNVSPALSGNVPDAFGTRVHEKMSRKLGWSNC